MLQRIAPTIGGGFIPNLAHPLNMGRVAWWLVLPSNYGQLTIPDLFGIANSTVNLCTYSAPTRRGAFGQLTFDGTRSYAQFGSCRQTLAGLSRGSLATWFRATAINNTICGWDADNFGDQGFGFTLAFQQYAGNWENTSSTTVSVASTQTSFPDGLWHHAALTYNGATITLYLDGANVGSAAATGALHAFNQPFRIGAAGGNTVSGFFAGNIDDTSIWNRCLSQGEILELIADSYQGYAATLLRSGPWVFASAGGAVTTNLTAIYGFPFEFLGDGASPAPSPLEWQASNKPLRGLPAEFQSAAGASANLPMESQTKDSPLTLILPCEALSAARGAPLLPIEWADAARWAPILPLESNSADGPVKASLPLEWQIKCGAQNVSLPLESLGSGHVTAYLPMEAVGSAKGIGGLPVESQSSLSAAARGPLEWLGGNAAAKGLPVESQDAAKSGGSLPIESQASTRGTVRIPLEWQITVAADTVRLPVEVLADNATKAILPIEVFASVTSLTAKTPLPLEWLGAAAPAQGLPIEATGAAKVAVGLPIESQIKVNATLRGLPVEALADQAAGRSLPVETLDAAKAVGGLPVESQSSQRAAARGLPLEWQSSQTAALRLPSEWLAGGSAAAVLPIESTATITPQTARAALPIEWTSAGRASGIIPLESTLTPVILITIGGWYGELIGDDTDPFAVDPAQARRP